MDKIKDPFLLDPLEVAQALDVDLSFGLSSEEVDKRIKTYGKNELPEEPKTPFWVLVLGQFEDTLVRILLGAAFVSLVMAFIEKETADFIEPFIISLILVLNAIVGVWQEDRAEGAIQALKSFVPKTSTVLRNGKVLTILAEELVPGDIVEVSVGNRVPADIRLIQILSTTFRVDESILNGESKEIIKISELISQKERFPVNMIFSGTAVVYGKARGVVVRTGCTTEIGSIEKDVREQNDVKTPLQVKLDEFGVLLSKVIGYICLTVFFINFLRWYKIYEPHDDKPLYEHYVEAIVHCLKVAVALAVAAIPEGLPAVVTTCLALGTRRMARHNALVRDLPSVESLGRCTVICSDKTGTLTTNRMSVSQVVTFEKDGSPFSCYLKDSKFDVIASSVTQDGEIIPSPLRGNNGLNTLATVAVMCNDASLVLTRDSRTDKVGEATEAALLTMSEKLACQGLPLGVDRYRLETEKKWIKNATFEFTRQRKSMSVHCTSSSNPKQHILMVKGAPEELLRRSSRVLLKEREEVLNASYEKTILQTMNMISKSGLRCIGFATKNVPHLSELDTSSPEKFEDLENDLTFVGLCGMLDPPRPEVKEAISKCHTAGIRVIVITGDKKETAEAICFQLGLLKDENTSGISFTGHDIDLMSPAEKIAALSQAVLFSRTDPSHKMQLVKILQNEKLICAMTGDGVNDAPALKRADIGIAMGSGTEVAKAASKMILADDNFATVVKAVEEGRAIFNNTRQFIRYLISSNIGEVACVLFTGLLGIPEALSPIQLLWVNLVTDGLPATALGFNAADPDIMEQAPRKPEEPIVNGWLFVRYMIIGIYVGLATVMGFLWWFLQNGFSLSDLVNFNTCVDVKNPKCVILANPESARAVALSILVVIEMLNALNALSENQSLLISRPSSNPWLILAITSSLLLHVGIMYIPFFARLFKIAPLGVSPSALATSSPWNILLPTDFTEWKAVFVFSFPIILIDEVLKYITRRAENRRRRKLK